MLEWSKAVNKTIEEIVHNLPPFPKVRESLAKLRERADILVVSATPQEALDREWAEHGIDKYVALIAGQEMGSKTEHLTLAAKGKYPGREHPDGRRRPRRLQGGARRGGAVLSRSTRATRRPRWERFLDEGIDRFFAKQYAGAYESEADRGVRPPAAQRSSLEELSRDLTRNGDRR